MTEFTLDRAAAERMDAEDPLGPLRERFVRDDPELIYLDGNSLGRLPHAAAERIAEVVRTEWGRGLVRSWSHWIDYGRRIGDDIGRHLVGAGPGQVAVSDSTTVNLYKLAAAALDARPGRDVIVTDDDNFPTDRYVLQGLADRHGLRVRMLHADLDSGLGLETLRDAIGPDTALVSLSHVAYRSGRLYDMAAINRLVHDAGALVLWDLCHSIGAVPVDLDSSATDLAVGCTYKYLNGGPGSPAMLYVRRDLQESLRQPIWGWFSQTDQFAMGPEYAPAAGIDRFLTGTPPIISMVAIEEGVRLLAEAGIGALRAKGALLTEYLIALADARLAPLGFTVATPRDPGSRGSHVSLHHDDAWRISQALVEHAKVVPDYRTPDRLRLGPAPITTRFTDVWDAVDRLAELVADGTHERFSTEPARVT